MFNVSKCMSIDYVMHNDPNSGFYHKTDHEISYWEAESYYGKDSTQKYMKENDI